MDERRADAVLRRAAQEQADEDEKQRRWRIARGTATAEDLAGPAAGPGPPARGAWMTELPPERRPKAAPSQVSQDRVFVICADSGSVAFRSSRVQCCWAINDCRHC